MGGKGCTYGGREVVRTFDGQWGSYAQETIVKTDKSWWGWVNGLILKEQGSTRSKDNNDRKERERVGQYRTCVRLQWLAWAFRMQQKLDIMIHEC